MANYRTASSSKASVTRALRVTALMAITAGAGCGMDLEPRQPGAAGVHAVKLGLKKHKLVDVIATYVAAKTFATHVVIPSFCCLTACVKAQHWYQVENVTKPKIRELATSYYEQNEHGCRELSSECFNQIMKDLEESQMWSPYVSESEDVKDELEYRAYARKYIEHMQATHNHEDEGAVAAPA